MVKSCILRSVAACWVVLGCLLYATFTLCFFFALPHPILYNLEKAIRPMRGTFVASALSISESLRKDLSVSVLQNMNLSNIAMFALYCLVFVVFILLDSLLIEFKEGIRRVARLPSDEVIKHYSAVSYEHDLMVIRSVARLRKDPHSYEVLYK